MAKMWAGRTAGNTDKIADDFNSSIRFDCAMAKQDITGSMAHAAMLGAQGIIGEDEAAQLIDGLQGILDDLQSGALEIDLTCIDTSLNSLVSINKVKLFNVDAGRSGSIGIALQDTLQDPAVFFMDHPHL